MSTTSAAAGVAEPSPSFDHGAALSPLYLGAACRANVEARWLARLGAKPCAAPHARTASASLRFGAGIRHTPGIAGKKNVLRQLKIFWLTSHG
jgi:hypothetical protein